MSAFTTRAQAAFKRAGWPRFVGSAAVVVVLLLLLVLVGPKRDEIRRRFEIYGAAGEIRLMPEISIDEGSDQIHQLPRSFQQPPPPSYEVEPDDADPRATAARPAPVPDSRTAAEVIDQDVSPDAEAADHEQVELTLPQQTSRDFRILKLVRPVYPVRASAAERRVPSREVEAAIFVGPDGLVQAAMVTRNQAGKVFEEEVLGAIRQWQFQWLTEPPPTVGRWIVMTWRFKSPFGYEAFSGTRPPSAPRSTGGSFGP